MSEGIKVHVIDYGAGRNLMMRYICPLTGKQVTKSAGTRNMKSAEREAGKWQAELREGRYQKPSRMAWEAFKEYYRSNALPALALVELHEHMKLVGKDNDRVFPEVHITSIYGHLKLVLKSCGLDSGRNCMFHKIRRTHATHLYLAGGDPTQSLGHESDAMTRGYYLDPRYTRNGFLADLLGVGGVFHRMWRGIKRAAGII